jgi:hydrogenase nickel incorporation protein HypB
MGEKIRIEKKVLSENDRIASEIRQKLTQRRILALNLVSSPGSGKTSLLEATLQKLGDRLNVAVIAGDVQTENDALRLKKAGGRIVRPLVTGGACHLDAGMVNRVLSDIDLDNLDLLFIENVGNLVCPAGYDLGEDMKVVLISTTEGDDKPLKYPTMFRRSGALIINKIDLLEYTDFDMDQVKKNALAINPKFKIFEISCRTQAGMDSWYGWLSESVTYKKGLDYINKG